MLTNKKSNSFLLYICISILFVIILQVFIYFSAKKISFNQKAHDDKNYQEIITNRKMIQDQAIKLEELQKEVKELKNKK